MRFLHSGNFLLDLDIFEELMIISGCFPTTGGKPMPKANSTPSLSNQLTRNPIRGRGATPKPKLLDRPRQYLRFRKYTQSIDSPFYCCPFSWRLISKKMNDPKADGDLIET
jgi:hypothetical protein